MAPSKKEIIIAVTLVVIAACAYLIVTTTTGSTQAPPAISYESTTSTPVAETAVKPAVASSTVYDSGATVTAPIDSGKQFYRVRNVATSTSSGGTTASTTTGSQDGMEGPYSYLFKNTREAMTSNIVGYFAHGAFAWYVPDWLVNNWQMKPFRAEGMIFAPKVRENIEDFSDIIMDVSTSTELLNAESLYYTMIQDIPKNEVITDETLLNKTAGDMITMQMETDTRIRHIVAYTRDFRRITDFYFMDGNGKTLQITFETKADIFPQFSDKIRDFVEGIGELKVPQG